MVYSTKSVLPTEQQNQSCWYPAYAGKLLIAYLAWRIPVIVYDQHENVDKTRLLQCRLTVVIRESMCYDRSTVQFCYVNSSTERSNRSSQIRCNRSSRYTCTQISIREGFGYYVLSLSLSLSLCLYLCLLSLSMYSLKLSKPVLSTVVMEFL